MTIVVEPLRFQVYYLNSVFYKISKRTKIKFKSIK